MTIEIIFLALVSTVRPTSLAAVYAMLATSRSRRLLPIYILSGLAFTIGFGLLVVLAFNGIDIGSGSDDTEELVEVIAGVSQSGPPLGGQTPSATDWPRALARASRLG